MLNCHRIHGTTVNSRAGTSNNQCGKKHREAARLRLPLKCARRKRPSRFLNVVFVVRAGPPPTFPSAGIERQNDYPLPRSGTERVVACRIPPPITSHPQSNNEHRRDATARTQPNSQSPITHREGDAPAEPPCAPAVDPCGPSPSQILKPRGFTFATTTQKNPAPRPPASSTLAAGLVNRALHRRVSTMPIAKQLAERNQ